MGRAQSDAAGLPGADPSPHRPVFGFTVSGAWHYRESVDEVNRAGSYLDDAGNIDSVLDGATMLGVYQQACDKLSFGLPPVVVEH